MNVQAIRILFLKDLYLSRRHLFAYFAAGIAAAGLTCVPNETISFVGFILIMTAAIAAGIHMIGTLLLGESIDQTRMFVMSLPVSLLDYSISKISVVLTTYLIPWSAMLACAALGTAILPWANRGSLAVLPAIFGFLLASFTLQLLVAVVSDSIGWTISVMVAGNVGLNVFFMKFFALPEVIAVKGSDTLTWPPVVIQIILVELALVVAGVALAFYWQTRKRDLI
jgi:hypothetical protein